MLSIVAIAISLWRCEPFTFDTVAILANILALMVAILLGVIAYNYFIQKEEIKEYKKEVSDGIFIEVMDIYISIMSSFGASRNSLGLFPLGVKVLERLDDGKEQDVTQVCTLLNKCFVDMSVEDRNNPVIKSCLAQLSIVLKKHSRNAASLQLLATIDNVRD